MRRKQAQDVNFDMKLSIFGEVSWRWHCSCCGPGSAIAQKLAKKKILPSAEEFPKNRQPHVKIYSYVRLDRRGLGCCPFGWHHDNGKDSRPSLWVHAPRSSGAPCWYCYAWRRGGNLFDFLCLWYGVSASEMWRRIRVGEAF